MHRLYPHVMLQVTSWGPGSVTFEVLHVDRMEVVYHPIATCCGSPPHSRDAVSLSCPSATFIFFFVFSSPTKPTHTFQKDLIAYRDHSFQSHFPIDSPECFTWLLFISVYPLPMAAFLIISSSWTESSVSLRPSFSWRSRYLATQRSRQTASPFVNSASL